MFFGAVDKVVGFIQPNDVGTRHRASGIRLPGAMGSPAVGLFVRQSRNEDVTQGTLRAGAKDRGN
jgi:hypothetical protein